MGAGSQDVKGEGVVLGIDPGSRHMGWALVRAESGQPNGVLRLDSGTLSPPLRDPLPVRLGWILRALQEIFETQPVGAVAVEKAFVARNPHTALVLGQARGLPIALGAARGLPVFEYPPSVIKAQVAGSGRAAKGQVRAMVQLLLGLPELPQEDEADALAVAIAHLRHAASPLSQASAPRLSDAVAAALSPVGQSPTRDYYAAVVRAAGARGGVKSKRGRRR